MFTSSWIISSALTTGSLYTGDEWTGSGSRSGSSLVVTIGSYTSILLVAVCELTGSAVNPSRNRF